MWKPETFWILTVTQICLGNNKDKSQGESQREYFKKNFLSCFLFCRDTYGAMDQCYSSGQGKLFWINQTLIYSI